MRGSRPILWPGRGYVDVKAAPTKTDLYGGRSPRDIPTYSTAEAAHYLRIPENTIRSWTRGREYPTSRGHRRASAVVPPADVARGLSFINLVELHVLGAIRRQHQVDMKNVRAAIEFLKDHFGSEHPLIDHEMNTDGKHLFVKKYGSLINASRQGQGAMEELLDAHLKRIDRNEEGLAVRLFPFTRKGTDAPRIVAIDPLVAYGRPVIVGSRIPTSDIVDRFRAGESPAELAYDYDRPQAEIDEAIRCELGTAA
ncbi:MAG: DUF433 domain-containing protein [Acidobacteria bacterium]|nr:DUF433 domain-containing protein [Acidobacteriota bacterium]